MSARILPPHIAITYPLEPSPELSSFLAALRPLPGPRQYDITATFGDGAQETRRAILEAREGDATCYDGTLVSGPRMADGAWSPSDRDLSGAVATAESVGTGKVYPLTVCEVEFGGWRIGKAVKL